MEVDEVKSVLGLRGERGIQMYLGLPAFTLRQKRLQFGYIRDRVQKKLLGWNQRDFSAGGKEVLIKAVIQAIPTYAMQCFRIPDSVCGDIDRLCAGFWWGDKEDGKRMHWVRWDRLCRPKVDGGLGFRDIRSFNKALLAKQLWRMITNPGSLVARVFSARYGDLRNLMSAEVKSNASFIWRSLMWSRDVVVKGMAWRVGNGEDISVFDDRWVAGLEGSLRSGGVDGGDEDVMVSSLISASGGWELAKVRRRFDPWVQAAVLRTPIGEVGARDERFWCFDEKGRFSVKSAYLVDIGYYTSHVHVSEPDRKSWSQLVWNISVPPKARVFLWRAMNNVIPTVANLRAHHVPTSGICVLCKDRWDSSEHALLFCPQIVKIWKQSRFWEVLRKARGMPLVDIARAIRGELGKDDYELWALMVWQVWSFVCQLKHPEGGVADMVSESSSLAVLEAYAAAGPTVMLADKLGVELGDKKWRTPGRGRLRVDVDARWNPNGGEFGIGVVVRDHEGKLVAALAKPMAPSSTPMMAEVMAVVQGVVFCVENDLIGVEIFTDSFLVARLMADPEEEAQFLPEDICDVLRVA